MKNKNNNIMIIDDFDEAVEQSETYIKYNNKIIIVLDQLYKVRIFANQVDGSLTIQIINIETQQDYRPECDKIVNADLKEEKENNKMIELAREIRSDIIKDVCYRHTTGLSNCKPQQ